MSRTLPVIAAAVAGSALVLATPLAALAASNDWDGDTSQYWSNAANWAGNTVPAQGDTDLNFVGASTLSENDIAANFQVAHLNIGTDAFTLQGQSLAIDALDSADGVTLQPDTNATITPDLNLSGNQVWTVPASSSLLVTSWITDASGTLTLDVDGTFESSGRLDGTGGAAEIGMVGDGAVILSGQGGAIGAAGFQAAAGTTHVTGFLGGTAFLVNGGTLSGGSANDPNYGVLESLTLDAGHVSPGLAVGGGDIGTLYVWNGFQLNSPGTLDLQFDGTEGDLISILHAGQLNGARLNLSMTNAPAVGTQWNIIASNDSALAGTLSDGDGNELLDGDEFVSNGQRYSIEYTGEATTITYLGAVPVVPIPTTPLAATGLDLRMPLTIGGVLLAAGATLIVVRRRTRHQVG